jgi:hypothetical protein
MRENERNAGEDSFPVSSDTTTEACEPVSEFRDVPTSTEHGAYICYFDVVLWVSDHLVANKDWPEDDENLWDEAERRIRALCESGGLIGYGFRQNAGAFDPEIAPIPSQAWLSLRVDIAEGQPAWDKEQHGARPYGEAWWRDPGDAGRVSNVAWTAVCFRKADVLKHWPSRPRIKRYFAEGPARAALVAHLRENPDSSREEALRGLRSAGHNVGKPTFERLWPDARVAAGLSRLARLGRKAKTVRDRPAAKAPAHK